MSPTPVIGIDQEPTMTLADIDADTGKYHDPTNNSEVGQRHLHVTDEEFLACLQSRRTPGAGD